MYVGGAPDQRLGERLDHLARLGLVEHHQPNEEELDEIRRHTPLLDASTQLFTWVVTSTPVGHLLGLRTADCAALHFTRRRIDTLGEKPGVVDPALVERELERRALGAQN